MSSDVRDLCGHLCLDPLVDEPLELLRRGPSRPRSRRPPRLSTRRERSIVPRARSCPSPGVPAASSARSASTARVTSALVATSSLRRSSRKRSRCDSVSSSLATTGSVTGVRSSFASCSRTASEVVGRALVDALLGAPTEDGRGERLDAAARAPRAWRRAERRRVARRRRQLLDPAGEGCDLVTDGGVVRLQQQGVADIGELLAQRCELGRELIDPRVGATERGSRRAPRGCAPGRSRARRA